MSVGTHFGAEVFKTVYFPSCLRYPTEGVEGIAAALNLRLQFSRNENVPSI